jgi:3-phosphoshikimate 1-carboxyvinyltransferase
MSTPSHPTYPSAYEVRSGLPLGGRLRVPGSKSLTQRYFNLALLQGLALKVRSPLLSEDTRLFLGGLEAAGVHVTESGGDLELVPAAAAPTGETRKVFCGNGGTMLRFLTATLATLPGTWHLDGVPRLRERPVGPLLATLRQLGARIECLREEGFAPLRIHGATLVGGEAELDASSSSQYLSAVLMAALKALRPTRLRVKALTSEPYVDLTLDAIAGFGGDVVRRGDVWEVVPTRLCSSEVEVEADFSAVAYPAAAAALCGTGSPAAGSPAAEISIDGVRATSRQGDRGFVDLLERMGARITWHDAGLHDAGLTVAGTGALTALDADLSAMPDQVPTLAALAPFARGTTRISNVAHLRIKESDRLAAMATELRRLGATVEELADGLVIPGVWAETEPPTHRTTVHTYGDHRVAMSLALVGLRRDGVVIENPGVVMKSYPDFWQDLESLRRPPLNDP